MKKEIIKYSNIHGVSFSNQNVPTVFPSHWHNSAEFSIILKKGCVFRIGEETFKPEPGDILLVWPSELHEIKKAPEEGYILLQFSSAILESCTDILTALRFFTKFHHLSMKKEPELCKTITGQINELIETYTGSQQFIETRCKVIIYNILLQIGEYVMQENKDLIGVEHYSDITWEYIRTACSFISEHSAEDISQSDVAAVTGLSPFYFSKIFKEYTHMTFPAYLAGIRVQSAINLLADKEHTITECAYLAGFQSTTTFNKLFREHTGCTPREFRKMHD
ncbi:MAG: AraC family transcriptional regulator [Eubacterium sp.]|nr:AraC family transcriptional regulator [Eubacterium sp.]